VILEVILEVIDDKASLAEVLPKNRNQPERIAAIVNNFSRVGGCQKLPLG
jgi:hypothetical protein